MNVTETAVELVDTAAREQQAVRRMASGDPVDELRAAVRSEARRRGIRIRTGLVDDVLAVVRADADIWHEPTATMRAKLTPAD